MREAIGVTLSVLCSNLRLGASSGNDHLRERETSADVKAAGSWDQFLVKRASELVSKIQNVTASEALEIPTEKLSENGMSSGHSKDDINWMETVLFWLMHILLLSDCTWLKLNDSFILHVQLFHFIISSLKSGRSSVLLDVLVELLYPVISLQVKHLVSFCF